MPNADEPRKGSNSFWSTLPGVLTAIAALLTAIVGVVGVLGLTDRSSGGGDEGVTHAEWVHRADQLCAESFEYARQFPPLEESNFVLVASALAREQGDLTEKLRALAAPEEDQLAISRFTALLDQERNEVGAAIVASKANNVVALSRSGQRIETLDSKADAAARSLGISACAQRVTPAGVSSF